jgi:hypothetical protein
MQIVVLTYPLVGNYGVPNTIEEDIYGEHATAPGGARPTSAHPTPQATLLGPSAGWLSFHCDRNLRLGPGLLKNVESSEVHVAALVVGTVTADDFSYAAHHARRGSCPPRPPASHTSPAGHRVAVC